MIADATMESTDTDFFLGWDRPRDDEPPSNPLPPKQPYTVPTKQEIVAMLERGENPDYAKEPVTKHIVPVPPNATAWFTVDGRLRGTSEPIAGRCGRKLRRADPVRYCSQWPKKGRTACKHCGGATPIGAVSPNYKGLDHSRYLPRNIRETDDPDYLSLRHEITMLKALQDHILQQMDSANDRQRQELWDEWGRTVDRTARIGAAEWNRMAALQAVVPVDQVLLLVRSVLQSQRNALKDHPVLLAKCQEGVLALLPPLRGRRNADDF